jgi:hypothetical protein
MDDQALTARLREILERSQQAYDKQHQNNERKKKWVKEQVWPAFEVLEHTLNGMRVEGVSKGWEEVNGWVTFKHDGKEFRYTIKVVVSPKGVTGTIQFRLPEYTSGPIENIVEWTQDAIIENFLELLGTWHPEER